MRFSYSRVDCFSQCRNKYKLRYIDKLTTYDECDAQDPLKIGTALHKGIETDVKTAIKEYYSSYPIITDLHVEEAIKLEYWIPKVKARLPSGGQFEVKIECDDFVGYIDYLVKNDDGTYDIYDFKYSNAIDRYKESKQLHVYKALAEKILNIKVRDLYFVFIPKVAIRMKKTENQFTFRKRLNDELNSKEITISNITYDKEKVNGFLTNIKEIGICTDYTKNTTKLCDWCEYKDYCIKGDDLNIVVKRWYEQKEEN